MKRGPWPISKRDKVREARDEILQGLAEEDGRSISPEEMEKRMAICENLMMRGYDTITEISANLKVSPDLAKRMIKRIYIRWETQTQISGRGGQTAKAAVKRKLRYLYRKLIEVFEEEGLGAKQRITAIKTAMENLRQQAQLLGLVGVPGVSNVNIGELTVKRFDEAQSLFVRAVGQALQEELDPVTLERVVRKIADISTTDGMTRVLQGLRDVGDGDGPRVLEADYEIIEGGGDVR